MSEKTTDQPKKRRLNQPIDEQVHRRLRVYAAKHDLKLPEAIERLLKDALDRQLKEYLLA